MLANTRTLRAEAERGNAGANAAPIAGSLDCCREALVWLMLVEGAVAPTRLLSVVGQECNLPQIPIRVIGPSCRT
jgi:hypothetical protein